MLSDYVVIADYDTAGHEGKRYNYFTLSNFMSLSTTCLKQKLRFERRRFILEKVKELKSASQIDLMESKTKRLNKIL